MNTGAVTAPSRPQTLGLLMLVLLAGFSLRLAAIGVDGLWMDEVFGASYTNLNPLEVVVAVLRFDIHPPGYYLQLDAWSLLSRSDLWLLLNSVFWSLLSVLVVYWGVDARAGRGAALVGAACTAWLGSEVFFASELRMYAMLGCHVLLLWCCVDAWLLGGGRARLMAIVALLLSLSLLHSTAFIAVGAVLCYAWGRALLAPQPRSLAKPLGLLTLLAGVLLLPWLVNASFRSVTHTRMPTPENVAQTLGGWLLGYFPGVGPHEYALAALLVLLMLVWLMVRGSAYVRLLVFAFVLAPMAVVALISLAVRPIWLDRTLAFCAPFLAVGLAVHLHERAASGRQAWARSAGLLLVWGTFVFGFGQLHERVQLPRKMQFREAAQFLVQANKTQRPVYVPSNVRFWAMARYLAGPDWGSLLAIQDPVRPDESETWRKVYARLGEERLRLLHLQPLQRYLDTPAGRLWIGLSPLPPSVTSGGYFYASDMSERTKVQACPVGMELSRHVFEGVMVFECK